MGNWATTHFLEPGVTPLTDAEPSFDPLFGFPNGRKERGRPTQELTNFIFSHIV